VASHATAQVPVPQLIQDMVGRNLERLFPDTGAPAADEVLRVDGLTGEGFRDISFGVRAGEILGIAGIVGAGRTELVRAIAGADPVASGTVTVDGDALRLGDPAAAIRAGVVLVPEDRKAQGVVLDLAIEDNIAVSNLDRLAEGGWVKPSKVRSVAESAIARLQVKGAPGQHVRALSGGNQQKVVIAKWLERQPRVIILDEPTRGIDMGARAAIYEVIAELARGGMAVIVVSSELEEVLGLSHRVMVLSRGEQRGLLDEATDHAVMELATT
jgi:ribose transport system ATP-binding protein